MRTTIKISHQIKVQEKHIPPLILRRIKNDLTLSIEEVKQAFYCYQNNDGYAKSVTMYSVDESGMMYLPRGYGSHLFKFLRDSQTPFRIHDERLILPRVAFNSTIQLRNNQEAAVNELVKWKQGGVVAPYEDKTMILLEAVARIQQPTLWITHKKELVEQLVEKACSALGMATEEIGIIQENNFTIGTRLTIALLQTLSRAEVNCLTAHFGTIIIDDADYMSAEAFIYPIYFFPALYRIWASSALHRDGWVKMVLAEIGSILYTLKQEEVPASI